MTLRDDPTGQDHRRTTDLLQREIADLPSAPRRRGPATLAAVALLAMFATDAAAQDSVETDRRALEALYDATGGTDWVNSTNWKTAAPLGEWHGVTTDTGGRVTELHLENNALVGVIPDALGNLTNLRSLDFGFNALTAPMPVAMTRLTNLDRLWLGFNELTGPVPPWLGDLTRLKTLDLGVNGFTGPIPDALGNLTNLEALYLGLNAMAGAIPLWLGELDRLKELDLGINGFSGPIPNALGNLTNLEKLRLHENWGLSGQLPDGLRLSRLRELNTFMTQTCAPVAWRAWLETIDFMGPLCEPATVNVTMDVAVVYTPAARRAAGGVAAIEALIDLMMAETNESYVASGVRHRVALVARSEVTYEEANDIGVDLHRLAELSDGHMDEAHALRDRFGADLVHLLVAGGNQGGVAFRPGDIGGRGM